MAEGHETVLLPLGDQMRLARQHSGISVTEAARRSHTSRSAIYSYESGAISPSLETAQRILTCMDHKLRVVALRGPKDAPTPT